MRNGSYANVKQYLLSSLLSTDSTYRDKLCSEYQEKKSQSDKTDGNYFSVRIFANSVAKSLLTMRCFSNQAYFNEAFGRKKTQQNSEYLAWK